MKEGDLIGKEEEGGKGSQGGHDEGIDDRGQIH